MHGHTNIKHEGMTCLELEPDVQLKQINFIFFHDNFVNFFRKN